PSTCPPARGPPMRTRTRSIVGLVAVLLVLATALAASARAGDGAPTLVDWLKSLGEDASYPARERLFAERFHDDAYTGSAAQNLALWKALRAEAAAGAFP